MLRWAISFAVNRLLIAAMIVLAMKAYGASNWRIEALLGEGLNIASPFDEISNALK